MEELETTRRETSVEKELLAKENTSLSAVLHQERIDNQRRLEELQVLHDLQQDLLRRELQRLALEHRESEENAKKEHLRKSNMARSLLTGLLHYIIVYYIILLCITL